MTQRTINDFNKEYYYKLWLGEIESAAKPSSGEAIKNTIYYFILCSMIVIAFFYSSNKDVGKRFGPFAYNTVLTYSMHSVYPQGSLITSWAVAPDEPLQAGLDNGTDIVFVKEDGTVVVHRIIEIINNYQDSGQRAFHTQGVDNPAPDSWITFEGNVIGRVTWHVPYAGNILSVVAENVLWVVGGIIIMLAIATMLKIVFKKEEESDSDASQHFAKEGESLNGQKEIS